MAEIQELEQEPAEIGELEAVEEATATPAVEQPPAAEPEELPEKYRGKSISEIARMHQEAERMIGRQAQEVGEVRRLADELLKSQLTPKPEAEKSQEVDFFENPQEAIRRAVESSPDVAAAKQYAQQAQRAQVKMQLQQLHPDMAQIVADQEFAQWVSGSPVRQQLMRHADQNFDLGAAHELLSTFKELRQLKQQRTASVDTAARDAALKSAAVETGGSGESSKKVYRRADLIRLKMHNPAKYESMQDEIMSAYSEGRVR